MEYWGPQQKKLGRVFPPPLQGQVAVVTGAGGAIGLGIADCLLAAGAVVAISDIDGASLRKVHAALVKKYGESQVESFLFDVTDYGAVEKAFQDIMPGGGIDVLVPMPGSPMWPGRGSELKFDQVIAVNLKGLNESCHSHIPKAGWRSIVVASSKCFDRGGLCARSHSLSFQDRGPGWRMWGQGEPQSARMQCRRFLGSGNSSDDR
jgi:NAD(P)-dependent dehydrogenase (short-subunit alcohol dehydrogenase family)